MIPLVPHPSTPGAVALGVRAAAARTQRGQLALRYRIEGELGRLRIPPPRAPAPGERLWQHLCCEAFVAPASARAAAGAAAGPGAGSYREFNFSPSGEWGAFEFQRYREGGPLAIPDPGIAVRIDGQALELSASIEVGAAKLWLGLCVVIEEMDVALSGAFSYWALRHPAARPDFHHPDGFALEIA